MAVNVNTNVTAMHGQHRLSRISDKQATSMERLSSGQKINSAKDDAAGLQISNRLQSQSRGMDVAIRNANDGISMLQTAEGAMDEYTENLMRMRDLTLRYNNDSLSEDDKKSIDKEFVTIKDELNRITHTTRYGKQNILNVKNNNLSFQVGPSSGQAIDITLPDLSNIVSEKDDNYTEQPVYFALVKEEAIDNWRSMPGDKIGISIIRNGHYENERDNLIVEPKAGSTLQEVVDELNDKYGDRIGVILDDSVIDSDQMRRDGVADKLRFGYYTTDDYYTRIVPYQYSIKYSNNPFTGPYSFNRYNAMFKEDMNSPDIYIPDLSTTDTNLVINKLDDVLNYIDSERAKIGATQNRLTHAINNLSQSSENVAASNSQIRDTDFSKEISELTKQSILKQVGTSMLAQASQTPQSALSLLS